MLREYLDLSVSDRVNLVEELLVSIQRDTDKNLSKEYKDFIDKRAEMATDNSINKMSWSEVKASIKRKK